MRDVSDPGAKLRRAQSPATVAAVNWLFTAVALLSAVVAYAAAAPPPVLWGWAGLGLLQLAMWATISFRLVPIVPQRSENPAFWAWSGKAIALGNNVVAVSGIWLLSPYGPPELHVVAMLFCVGYIAVAIMATQRFSWVHYLAAVTGIGSLIAVMFRGGGPYAPFLAPFLAAFGAGVLLLGHILQRSRTTLETAWREAEAARQAALAERDARLHFLASASHDFGQPLQAARLYFEQMQLGTAAERDRAGSKLERSLDVMEQMVTQMTHHLRLDAGVVIAARAAVPLTPLIARVIEQNEGEARRRGAGLRTLPTSLSVQGDPVLVERALGNLVGNAVRHAHARRILVGARQRGAVVRLWVIDDGRGVAPRDRATLFEPYVQGSDHAGEVRGGYGLGLSSVRLMAEAMGGTAGQDPRWRNGSAFFLELPASRPQPASVGSASSRGRDGRAVLPDLR